MYTVVFNPSARGGRIRRHASRLRSVLDTQLGSYTWVETGSAEEGRAVAREASADHVVVAVGGDGSVHTVVEGLADSQFRGALGVIPIGTGNDFAFGAGLPSGLEAAIGAIASGATRFFDVGQVSIDGGPEQPFVNALGMGFDAAASIHSRRRTFLPGVVRYLVSSLETLARWDPPRTVISGSTFRWAGPLMFVTVGNAPRSGGGFLITPDADPADGLLDVCAVRGVGKTRAVSLIPRVMKGSHGSCPEVVFTRGSAFRVQFDEPVPVHADGEILSEGAREVRVSILPGRLRLAGAAPY